MPHITTHPTSRARADAARRNGRLSRGPRNTSRTRYNAVKHGILSQAVHLKTDEDRRLFSAMLEALREEWRPATQSEIFYLERIAQCMWRLRLIELHFPCDGKTWSDVLSRAARYERMVSRELTIAEEKLRALQEQRLEEEALARQQQHGETQGRPDCAQIAPDQTNPATTPLPEESTPPVEQSRPLEGPAEPQEPPPLPAETSSDQTNPATPPPQSAPTAA